MHDELIQKLQKTLGNPGILTVPADMAPYCEDWRGLYRGRAAAVLRPATTEQVADAVRLCAEHNVAVVPQGGNTGMVGGTAITGDGSQIVVNLSRLNRIRTIDPIDMTLEVEAGVTLKAAQDAVETAGCLLPLSISSEGTAQIGGVLAVNAGGNNTVKYGNARDLLLGLEVVLPDGQIWNGLRRLRKDNTGYCLRQLFAGSEGTLGIITAAVMKLAPRPRQIEAAMCAVESPQAALDLFRKFQHHDPDAILAFEYMSGEGLDLVIEHIPGASLPLGARAPGYVLVELGVVRTSGDLRAELELILSEAFEAGLVSDAVIAESGQQRASLWKLREEHSEAQKREGASVKNDVSVPVSAVPELLRRASESCERLVPGIRVMPFGHIGDGNIHFNLLQPKEMQASDFLARDREIMSAVNEVVQSLHGSFSAEHGVGCLKTPLMRHWRGGPELEIMHRLKRALDPQGLLNPKKVLPS